MFVCKATFCFLSHLRVDTPLAQKTNTYAYCELFGGPKTPASNTSINNDFLVPITAFGSASTWWCPGRCFPFSFPPLPPRAAYCNSIPKISAHLVMLMCSLSLSLHLLPLDSFILQSSKTCLIDCSLSIIAFILCETSSTATTRS